MKLPTEFKSKGFTFKLLQRSEKHALYERSKPDGTPPHFEVIAIQWHKEHTWPNGKTTEAGEYYPSTLTWGAYGWTFSAASHRNPYDEALKFYLTLCQEGHS